MGNKLSRTPNVLNGRDKQPDEPGAGRDPQKLSRRQRRTRLRITEKAQQRRERRPSGTGAQRLARWQTEAHVELIRQANRLGIDVGAPNWRRRACIELARQQAAVAKVSNATWACANRKERALMIERSAA